MIKFLGIGGVATSGKDTLYLKIKERYGNLKIKRFAFADNLKKSLNEETIKRFNISCFTSEKKEKDIIRPFLVSTAKENRIKTDGKFYWGLLFADILNEKSSFDLGIITDVRYNQYPYDEVFFIKKILNGKIVHLTRIDENGNEIKPANEEETNNDILVQKISDLKIKWKTHKSLKELDSYMLEIDNLIL